MAAEYTEYEYVEAGKIDISELPPLDAETDKIMKKEFSTGFKLTLFYYSFIFMIPVLNWFAPDFMFSNMWGGMTYAWFFTGIVAMGMAFAIAYVHTHLYEKRLKKNQKIEASTEEKQADGRSAI